MGGDREHTITVDIDGDLSIDGGDEIVVSFDGNSDLIVQRPDAMTDDEARAILTAPRMRPLPDGAPEGAVWGWEEGLLLAPGDCWPCEGWEWTHVGAVTGTRVWRTADPNVGTTAVWCRPIAPPTTERVRLGSAVLGRTLAGEDQAIYGFDCAMGDTQQWWPQGGPRRPLPLDADGMVEVIAP
mgnify:CR=1 FL=1